MIYEVEVTKKHIKDAFESIILNGEEKQWCPVALAMYEQIGKEKYKVIRRNTWGRYKKGISFTNEHHKNGGASNMFSVANTIQCNINAIPEFKSTHCHPPIYLKLPKKVEKFIIDFDKGRPVEPIKFSIEIKP